MQAEITLRQAAQQALEALEPEWWETGIDVENKQSKAAQALRAALAEPEQEPVAVVKYMKKVGNAGIATRIVEIDDPLRERLRAGTLLYTAPTPRKPLTDEEIDRVTDQQWAQNNHKPIYAAHRAYARAIERKHGIGEQHE